MEQHGVITVLKSRFMMQIVSRHHYSLNNIFSNGVFSASSSNKDFLPAQDCPGAAIVFVKIQPKAKHALGGQSEGDSEIYHLHTGDMRFHQKFKEYPLLKEVIAKNKLDILYLDTTYAKPKHTFIPQDDAIHMIASQVKELLNPNDGIVHEKKNSFFKPKLKSEVKKPTERTLVLLSCYSIGKEKVLWQSAVESNQLIYCNKSKQKMLNCIECHKHIDESAGIIHRCTLDKQKSDIHVISMGTAGKMFPFFQPNFEECALYAHRMNKGYTKVVAFIPTGWADASKYNKTNAVSAKTMDLKDLLDGSKINGNDHFMKVEVRLVAYSEHSSYTELRDCVEFMKPKRVIPTVFSGEKDYQTIEKRFIDLVDAQRAKQAFINKIGGPMARPKIKLATSTTVGKKRKFRMKMEEGLSIPKNDKIAKQLQNKIPSPKKQMFLSTNANKKDGVTKGITTCFSKKGSKQDCKLVTKKVDDWKISQLVSMGFTAKVANESLNARGNNLERAIEYLLMK